MRTITQLALALAGGALALTGVFQDKGSIVGAGGTVLLIGGIMWITAPTKPRKMDGGNRPKHDPTNFIGWRD